MTDHLTYADLFEGLVIEAARLVQHLQAWLTDLGSVKQEHFAVEHLVGELRILILLKNHIATGVPFHCDQV